MGSSELQAVAGTIRQAQFAADAVFGQRQRVVGGGRRAGIVVEIEGRRAGFQTHRLTLGILDAPVGGVLPDAGNRRPFAQAEADLMRENLERALSSLESRERAMIVYRFGLSDDCVRSLEETGRFFNVTRERVRQIEARALRKLRQSDCMKLLREYRAWSA